MSDPREVAAAIRQIARGLQTLAEAIADGSERPSGAARSAALLREWGDRGLTRAEASQLFRAHGFAPQTAGGWAKAAWIEARADGLRYVSELSRQWLATQEEADGGD